MGKLIPIVLPGIKSKEFVILLFHTFFLISRTLVSIYVAQLDGAIVKSIVDRKLNSFIYLMMKWMAIAIPATYINSMINYLENKLSIAFRTRLVSHCYKLYMANETYYRIGNLDSRLTNPDQCLTEDVQAFCADLAHLYSHLSKPCLDIVLMTTQLIMLSRKRGSGNGRSFIPTALAAGVIGITGFLLKLATPPFGKLIAEQAKRYGELRAAHSRLIASAEEVAFYGGHRLEENILHKSYDDLIKHINVIYKAKIFYTMLEQFLMRYVWGACGMLMIAIPTFQRAADEGKGSALIDADDNVSTRTQDFVTSRGLLISAADAVERMMSSWKEITELAGRTARISEMIEIFNQVQNQVYQKKQATATAADALNAAEPSSPGGGIVGANGKKKKKKVVMSGGAELVSAGVVHDNCSYVKLTNVPVVTPNGDVLIDEPGLSFTIQPGNHLLITGPNGCGKSSLFRMIGGLWPVRGGELCKPAKGDMFYIPQRPYLTNGTLRDQFIYPHTQLEFNQLGYTDESLNDILDVVHLHDVVDREGGLDAMNDWRDVLSGGEKQRVGMARVFYHKPHFAILDECTSAVSIDVEGRMYSSLKERGITLLTVTHRPTLWKYHTHLLQFDGK